MEQVESRVGESHHHRPSRGRRYCCSKDAKPQTAARRSLERHLLLTSAKQTEIRSNYQKLRKRAKDNETESKKKPGGVHNKRRGGAVVNATKEGKMVDNRLTITTGGSVCFLTSTYFSGT